MLHSCAYISEAEGSKVGARLKKVLGKTRYSEGQVRLG
jgi:hypothetical protein